MTSILARCKMTTAAVAADGDTPAVPSRDYYFLSTFGVYAGDIASATGVLAEAADTDYSDFPLTPVKSLLRKGLMAREQVIVKDSTGKKYRKTLLVNDVNSEGFDEGILGKIWPVGKGAGAAVSETTTPVRVVSRR